MRWSACVGVIVISAVAQATSLHGVFPAFPFPPPVQYTVVEATDAGPGRAGLSAELEVDVSSLLLYVDAVDVPGEVQVQVFSMATGTLLKVGTSNIAMPGWVEFPLTGGAPTTPSQRVELRTTNARVRFRHVPVDPWGFDLGPTQRPRARVTGSSFDILTGVFRLATGTDPLADSSCGSQGAVAGSPYAFVRSVSLGAGPQTQVALAWMPNTPPDMAVGLSRLRVASDGGVAWALGYEDGGTVELAVDLTSMPPHPALFPTLVPPQQHVVSPPFRIIARQGAGEWLLASPGPGLDVCHPAVRAGYGGARARAEGFEAGADFMAWLNLSFAGLTCRDDDGDRHAGAPGCGLWAGDRPPPGMARGSATPDCDDADPARHWLADERCDGVDNDCDGQLDESPLAIVPLCSRQAGLCQGARLRESQCVDGGWVSECGVENYGSWFGQSEAACGSVDWNCDGVISHAVPCRLQAGVCAGSTNNQCTGTDPSVCGADRYGPNFDLYEVRCDGLDNDCDGVVDDVQPQNCPLQLGVCEGSQRTAEQCVNGTWAPCGAHQYGQRSAYELIELTCDGLDNDCDGALDEEDDDLLSCERQLGVCAGAHRGAGACANGVRSPCGASEYGVLWQQEETRCDGLDNDCDGVTDEGCARANSDRHATPVGSHCSCTAFDPGALLVAMASLVLRRRRC